MPSTSPDPLPTVVLEAMGCGKAVIGYAHGGITEMVQDGYNGKLVPPLNKVALKKAVKKCIESKAYISYGQKSRHRLIKSFSLEKFRNNFEDIYNDF